MRLFSHTKLAAGLLATWLSVVLVSAQPPRPVPTVQPPLPAVPNTDDDTEVLARGPIHEAYATTAEMPAPSPIVDRQPPAVVEELPPDQKPDGDNVLWIPGYWHYDDDRTDFIWISGFWRNAPVGRVWVPGDWREVRGGYQWVPGFWNVVAPQQQPAQLEYLPPPPALIENGPTTPAPTVTCFYTPGCWVYRVNRYVWRPGYWVEHRPDWVWVPDHYRWTPCGYVFIPGYWDCPLATRGVLFAPVYFRPAVFNRPRFVYTPAYVVPDTNLHTCLFVRTGHAAYYFGDYFEPRYTTVGFSSWCGSAFRGSGFAVSVSVTRTTNDPLWSYYSLTYRDTPQWQTNVASVYAGRFRGDVPRPPRTVVQNNVTNVTNVTNITNTTNNKTVVNTAPVVVAPLRDFQQTQAVNFKKVADDDRVREQKQAKELTQLAAERRKVETGLVDKGLAVTNKDDKPRQAKLEVPQTMTLRAQAPADPVKAPPPPAAPAKVAEKKPDLPAFVVPIAKPVVAPPVVDPKTGAVTAVKKVVPTKATEPAKTTEPAKPTPPPMPKPTDPVKPSSLPTPLPNPVKLPEPAKPPASVIKPTTPVEPPKPNNPTKLPPAKPADVVKPPVSPVVPSTPQIKPIEPPKPASAIDRPKPTTPLKPPVNNPMTPTPIPTPPANLAPKPPVVVSPMPRSAELPKPQVATPPTSKLVPPTMPKSAEPPKPKEEKKDKEKK